MLFVRSLAAVVDVKCESLFEGLPGVGVTVIVAIHVEVEVVSDVSSVEVEIQSV